ncbi:hypothetical protein PPL_01919 [Heterostelium album PN500]|uniref:Uncharacterized protein n=1 Tax=Heterostelium pallidum (strain ATCC 26659 / Pp 5 / PN500) TaxID=670386 RepID=D3B0V2_HETP5|nr:hypothetical protein PPL_01919 [Heterostelium album PN500]EFA84926.1 hypothetical protein PPL_01919 [Heterostelium album PN500]|eukprot:XP_020437036.1 hypothetical protein PPL_01919 [Heterostelium album PN500]
MKLRSSVLNPYCTLKNICNLTLSTRVFNVITKNTVSGAIELGMIFNNVRRFCMYTRCNNYGNNKDNSLRTQQCKSIVRYMPNLESLLLYQLFFYQDAFQTIKTLPHLTSLDLSSSQIDNDMSFTSDLISNSIKKLKLPLGVTNRYQSILSDQHQITTFGMGNIKELQIQMLSSHLTHLTKLIIHNFSEKVETSTLPNWLQIFEHPTWQQSSYNIHIPIKPDNSVLKNISHLTLTIEIFNEINYKLALCS